MGHGNAAQKYFPGMTKLCRKCGETFVVTEEMCRQHRYRCKPCDSKRAVSWAENNRAKKRAGNNAYHARISAKRAERTRAYRERHPEKKAAHQAVQTATRSARLTKRPCEVCGTTDVHAHHDDYSKPLDVIWLCHLHHMERHAMIATRDGDPR